MRNSLPQFDLRMMKKRNRYAKYMYIFLKVLYMSLNLVKFLAQGNLIELWHLSLQQLVHFITDAYRQ
jgi:hypothetical protein